MGKKFDQRFELENCIEADPLVQKIQLKQNGGIVQTFMLNQVLTGPGFLQDIDKLYNQSAKTNKKTSGQQASKDQPPNQDIYEAIKGKKDASQAYQSQQFFNCCMFLGLDQNTNGLVYFNIDALLHRQTAKVDK